MATLDRKTGHVALTGHEVLKLIGFIVSALAHKDLGGADFTIDSSVSQDRKFLRIRIFNPFLPKEPPLVDKSFPIDFGISG